MSTGTDIATSAAGALRGAVEAVRRHHAGASDRALLGALAGVTDAVLTILQRQPEQSIPEAIGIAVRLRTEPGVRIQVRGGFWVLGMDGIAPHFYAVEEPCSLR